MEPDQRNSRLPRTFEIPRTSSLFTSSVQQRDITGRNWNIKERAYGRRVFGEFALSFCSASVSYAVGRRMRSEFLSPNVLPMAF